MAVLHAFSEREHNYHNYQRRVAARNLKITEENRMKRALAAEQKALATAEKALATTEKALATAEKALLAEQEARLEKARLLALLKEHGIEP